MIDREYQTLNDGCEGDSEGLAVAVTGATLLWEGGSDYGWGHHHSNAIWTLPDGRYVTAECGGCSCGVSGSWGYRDTFEQAISDVPSEHRNGDFPTHPPVVSP